MVDQIQYDRLQISVESSIPPVVAAMGELDHENCDVLEKAIGQVFDESGATIALALAGLSYVDSSGIRVLATKACDAKEMGGCLKIVSIAPQLSRLLKLSGLDQLFMISAVSEEPETVVCISSGVTRSFCFSIPAKSEACCDARRKVCSFVTAAGLEELAIDDINLAVGEALANAVRHGVCDGGAVEVRCHGESERIQVSLRYPSQPFDPDSIPIPDMQSAPEGGMGIHFMRLVMDSVEYRFESGYAILVLEKRKDGEE